MKEDNIKAKINSSYSCRLPSFSFNTVFHSLRESNCWWTWWKLPQASLREGTHFLLSHLVLMTKEKHTMKVWTCSFTVTVGCIQTRVLKLWLFMGSQTMQSWKSCASWLAGCGYTSSVFISFPHCLCHLISQHSIEMCAAFLPMVDNVTLMFSKCQGFFFCFWWQSNIKINKFYFTTVMVFRFPNYPWL